MRGVRNQLVVVATCLALGLAVAPGAFAERQTRGGGGGPRPRQKLGSLTWIMSGGYSDVWGNQRNVVKVPRTRTFVGRGLTRRSAAETIQARRAMSRETVVLMDRLRSNPALRRRFGDIFPATRATPAGYVIQDRSHGLTTVELSPEAGRFARAEMAVAIRLARRALGRRAVIDEHRQNFRFDRTGKIVSWFDPFVGPEAARENGPPNP